MPLQGSRWSSWAKSSVWRWRSLGERLSRAASSSPLPRPSPSWKRCQANSGLPLRISTTTSNSKRCSAMKAARSRPEVATIGRGNALSFEGGTAAVRLRHCNVEGCHRRCDCVDQLRFVRVAILRRQAWCLERDPNLADRDIGGDVSAVVVDRPHTHLHLRGGAEEEDHPRLDRLPAVRDGSVKRRCCRLAAPGHHRQCQGRAPECKVLHYQSPGTRPSSGQMAANQTVLLIDVVTVRTLPSHMAT